MPDRPRLVVVNTTPIIALVLIDQLNLLHKLYGRVVIPSAVQAEVSAGGAAGIGVRELREATWIEVMSLQDPSRANLMADLDRGEAEVIALAQEQSADLVVVDERLARRHAKRLGMRLTGTCGIVLKAKQLGIVEAVAPLIDQLRQSGIRLGDDVVSEVLSLADELW
jgi:predicted nucleic acid-binding protein